METKELFGVLSVVVGCVGFAPYFWDILKKRTKPHAFTWIVWTLLAGIVFFAQAVDRAGPGAWATGFTAAACLLIAVLALQRGEKQITRSDWTTFVAALAAIPLWYFTAEPFYVVLLVTGIDGLACYPTYRKSWAKPQEETAKFYALAAIKFVLALFALENHTAVTMLYPSFLIIANGALLVLILWRRRALR
ncbi:MAG: hypothetical protein HGA90_07100 [Alphaproteobacteria bacterium]|nr:hypothetical protein [Alphaproteobacteria bacterium]